MQPRDLIASQRAFFLSGATRPQDFRIARLRELARLLETHEPEILDALHTDLRKSPQEAYASEIGLVLTDIRHAIRHLPSWMKPSRRHASPLAWPAKAEVRREPFGVALIIGPWNYPLQLLLGPLVGSIAAGNCTILKPSEAAPHTSSTLATLINNTFPPEFLTVVEGGRDASKALLAERFDKIFFTGGTTTGKAVMAAAARHLTPVTLELGGKSPCIVTADAPPAIAARRILWGKFLNAGQTCVAPDHVWVERKAATALIDAMRETLETFYGPDPQQSPDYSRIINRAHFDRLIALLPHGKIVHGGDHNADDLYIAPTLVTGITMDSPLMTEEIFGPILPILGFDNLDELLEKLRASPAPLACYVFSQNKGLQRRVIEGTRSGGVCCNSTILHILGHHLPFGGLGESGMGNYHGRASFDCFSHERSILHTCFTPDFAFHYPPAKTTFPMLKRIFRFLG